MVNADMCKHDWPGSSCPDCRAEAERPRVAEAVPEPGPRRGALEIVIRGEVQKMEYQPGDRFVLHVPASIPADITKAIHEAWETFAPGAKLLIITGGNRLGGPL